MLNYREIIRSFQEQQEAANQANEQRYEQLLGQLRGTQSNVLGTHDQIIDMISSLGDEERQDIERRASQAMSQADQDLISRGLNNTTVRESVKRGVQSDAERANRKLTEQLTAQRATALQSRAQDAMQLGNMIAGAIERRTDRGPDAGLLAQLMQSMGEGQGANSGGGYSAFRRSAGHESLWDRSRRRSGGSPGQSTRRSSGGFSHFKR